MVQGTEGTPMPVLSRPRNPTVPAVLPQIPPSSSRGSSEPNTSGTWDYGFKHFVPLLLTPHLRGGIMAITLFFFIAFFSNILLAQVTMATLGITVTMGTFGILALILLILSLF